ncbi:PREDICTED: max-interacting protein 1 [Nanorana parkeri]|uniref:max-interacting protein 1 n=1 Tax=Nanorana parkeri TaxID=125878 RepID=UPI000854E71F|nr:PREDICTED: max-interacting protein 1 [Nanorana parkeri]
MDSSSDAHLQVPRCPLTDLLNTEAGAIGHNITTFLDNVQILLEAASYLERVDQERKKCEHGYASAYPSPDDSDLLRLKSRRLKSKRCSNSLGSSTNSKSRQMHPGHFLAIGGEKMAECSGNNTHYAVYGRGGPTLGDDDRTWRLRVSYFSTRYTDTVRCCHIQETHPAVIAGVHVDRKCLREVSTNEMFLKDTAVGGSRRSGEITDDFLATCYRILRDLESDNSRHTTLGLLNKAKVHIKEPERVRTDSIGSTMSSERSDSEREEIEVDVESTEFSPLEVDSSSSTSISDLDDHNSMQSAASDEGYSSASINLAFHS